MDVNTSMILESCAHIQVLTCQVGMYHTTPIQLASHSVFGGSKEGRSGLGYCTWCQRLSDTIQYQENSRLYP